MTDVLTQRLQPLLCRIYFSWIAAPLTLVLFALEFGLCLTPSFVWRMISATLGALSAPRDKGRTRAQQVRLAVKLAASGWLTDWGYHICGWPFAMLGIRLHEDVPPELLLTPGEQFVLVANHQNVLDALLYLRLAKRLKLNVTWAAKKGLGWVPVVGWSLVAVDAAFLRLKGDPLDLERVRDSARLAQRDGFTGCILPEGHRQGGRAHTNGRVIGKVRTNGFVMICNQMRGLRVLEVQNDCSNRRAKTILDVHMLVGVDIRVSVFAHTGVTTLPDDQKAEWLIETFERMDRRMRSSRAYSRADNAAA